MDKSALESWLGTLDTWLLVFGVIVAIGVVGEAIFGFMHWRAAKQLQTIQTAENLSLQRDIERFRQVAAEANDRAKQAELALAQLRLPRPFDENAFLAALRGKPSWPVDEILYVDAADDMLLASQISVALKKAGWRVPAPQPIQGPNPASPAPGLVSVTTTYGAGTTGVSVVASAPSAEPTPQTWLVGALNDSLPAPWTGVGLDLSMRPSTLRIVVAPRL